MRVARLTGKSVLAAVILGGCAPPIAGNKPGPSLYAMTHPGIVPTKSGHPDALYVPNPIRVHTGQIVTWRNTDTDPHDVTSTDGLFDSGPIAHGATFSWRATYPGRYPYFCTIHPDMRGLIIVQK